MRSYLTGAASALVLAAGLSLAGPAAVMAQEAYSEQKLDAFVEAVVQVRQLSSVWQERIEAAGTEEKASELRDQAGQELVAAVEGTEGITLAEYNQIVEDARQNPDLSARIGGMLQERTTE
ncbi:MAG: DUF4168 domain-containing protein [Kiloniellales bacterium]